MLFIVYIIVVWKYLKMLVISGVLGEMTEKEEGERGVNRRTYPQYPSRQDVPDAQLTTSEATLFPLQ